MLVRIGQPRICIVFMCLVINLCSEAKGEESFSNTLSHGDPGKVLAVMLMPLLSLVPKADQQEKLDFSPTLKGLVQQYFSSMPSGVDYFDADLLLGIQDYSSLSAQFGTLILDESHAIVRAKLVGRGGEDKRDMVVRYEMEYFGGPGWKINDIVYDDGVSLRNIIMHTSWCSFIAARGDKREECRYTFWSISNR